MFQVLLFMALEKPHGLSVGSTVEINNITSSLFPTVGVGNSGYNGTYEVTGITRLRHSLLIRFNQSWNFYKQYVSEDNISPNI